ncbi:Oidioi.mRNA.OKI2018_I69.PAR.g11623.t2.cds [Oikopleura dioica]|uniref:Oidioi.mRNA.OKI2018_I69.PAR.g11623.t2.cds n=1 Tax=Oikopleura dioica TaxID=34765 RepID=A0ABN7S0Q9_OIKDI|nr:Oidioi.mRNA.OKI2018_I69.PAR.g11623.t2.cds [Oikopleura dioica]
MRAKRRIATILTGVLGISVICGLVAVAIFGIDSVYQENRKTTSISSSTTSDTVSSTLSTVLQAESSVALTISSSTSNAAKTETNEFETEATTKINTEEPSTTGSSSSIIPTTFDLSTEPIPEQTTNNQKITSLEPLLTSTEAKPIYTSSTTTTISSYPSLRDCQIFCERGDCSDILGSGTLEACTNEHDDCFECSQQTDSTKHCHGF